MPAFLTHSASDTALGADVLVIPLAGSSEGLIARLVRFGGGVAGACARALELGDLRPAGRNHLLVHSHGIERFPRVLLVDLGAEDAAHPARIRGALARAASEVLVGKLDSVALPAEAAFGAGGELERGVAAAVDGFQEAAYRWSAASGGPRSAPSRFVFLAETGRARGRIERGIAQGRAVAESVSLAKDLANAPANRMSPEMLAQRALAMAREVGLSARVLRGPGLARERLEAIRTVGAGSSREPRLIVLEHNLSRGGPPVALVGKGLVFDSGGLSIKSASSMAEMKFDKCGACVVLGALRAAAVLGLPLPAVAVVPAVENSISAEAYRPGDIIGSRSGRTIEVMNTDAEGRLVLADALDYAVSKYEPQAVIDAATLTGSVYHALGDRACAVLGTSEKLVERLRQAGDRCGERVWPLPLWEEYLEDVETPNADVKNTSQWGAGTIAGAAFLRKFVGETPWAHLDIAGVSRHRRDPKAGATGFGVRLLVEMLRAWPRPRRPGPARGAGGTGRLRGARSPLARRRNRTRRR